MDLLLDSLALSDDHSLLHYVALVCLYSTRAVENDVGRIVKYGTIRPAPLTVNACRVCLPHVQQCVTLVNERSGHHADTLRFRNKVGCNTLFWDYSWQGCFHVIAI